MGIYDFLEKLKPGSIVVRRVDFGPDTLTKVVRITKTQIITQGREPSYEERWRRKSGRLVGSDNFNRLFIVEATPTLVERIRHFQRCKVIAERFKHWDASDANEVTMVKQIAAMLEAERKRKGK